MFYGGTSSFNFLFTSHQTNKIPRKDLLDDTRILAKEAEKRKLFLAEAILIKQEKPCPNSHARGRPSPKKIRSLKQNFSSKIYVYLLTFDNIM